MRNRAGNFSVGAPDGVFDRARTGRADHGEADTQGAGRDGGSGRVSDAMGFVTLNASYEPFARRSSSIPAYHLLFDSLGAANIFCVRPAGANIELVLKLHPDIFATFETASRSV